MKNYLVMVLVWFSCAMSAIAQENSLNHTHSTKQYTLIFRVNETVVDREYMNNGSTIDALTADLKVFNQAADTSLDSIMIVASASPEGSYSLNRRLAIQRSEIIKGMLLAQHPELNPEIIFIESYPNQWSETIHILNDNPQIPYRDTILSVLTDPKIEHKDAALRSMPEVWDSMRSTILDKMRTASITICLTRTEVIPAAQEPEPEPEPEPAPSPKVEPAPEPQPEPVVEVRKRKMIMAARTNLLVPGMNFGLEFPIKDNWSIGIDYYFPWLLPKSNTWCFETLGGFVEARYWFPGNKYKWSDAERLQGHSIGLYGGVGYYDYQLKDDGLQGEYIDVGVDYTFALPVAKGKLRMEFNIGLGFIRSWYRPYYMSSDYVDLIKEPGILYNTTNFFGPTRAGVSFVVPIVAKTKSTRKGGE